MHHRRKVKLQVVLTQIDFVSVFYLIQILFDTVKAFEEIEGLIIAYDFYFGKVLYNLENRTGVIRFHVVDHQVIELLPLQEPAQFLQKERHL